MILTLLLIITACLLFGAAAVRHGLGVGCVTLLLIITIPCALGDSGVYALLVAAVALAVWGAMNGVKGR